MRRSGGLALKTTFDLNVPTRAWSPNPTRICSIGLYAMYPPITTSAEPSSETSEYRDGEGWPLTVSG